MDAQATSPGQKNSKTLLQEDLVDLRPPYLIKTIMTSRERYKCPLLDQKTKIPLKGGCGDIGVIYSKGVKVNAQVYNAYKRRNFLLFFSLLISYFLSTTIFVASAIYISNKIVQHELWRADLSVVHFHA